MLAALALWFGPLTFMSLLCSVGFAVLTNRQFFSFFSVFFFFFATGLLLFLVSAYRSRDARLLGLHAQLPAVCVIAMSTVIGNLNWSARFRAKVCSTALAALAWYATATLPAALLSLQLEAKAELWYVASIFADGTALQTSVSSLPPWPPTPMQTTPRPAVGDWRRRMRRECTLS